MTIPGFVTPSDLSELLGGVSLQAVYKQLKNNEIQSHSAKNKRRWISPSGVRQFLEKKNFSFPNINVSFQIVKGGTGKTTLAYALAIRASHYGARVLAIDFDQQANLTRSFNVDARNETVWLNIVRDGVQAKESVIKVSPNLHLIPSNLNNSRLDVEITGLASNLRDMVRDKLEAIRHNYDLVVMDCPPAINKINTAVTCASDRVIIPVNPDPYAFDGLAFTLAEVNRVKKEFKISTEYRIIWNRYDARERLGVVYMHKVAAMPDCADYVLPVVVRTDASVKNAIFAAKSVYELPKRSPIQGDIDQFTREILGINSWKEIRTKTAV
jgi:chromosome partitioning protein